MKFALIGGDMRQVKLGELLENDGHAVSYYALDKACSCAETAKLATDGADCVILPLPTVKNGVLNAPLSENATAIEDVLSAVSPYQMLFAGKIDAYLMQAAKKRGLELIDYLEREEFTVMNAAATAEGAVQLILENTDIMLTGAKCLVVGYGRIGKALAERLAGLYADVTVSAREESDLAWMKMRGVKQAYTKKIAGIIDRFDVVVNTAPALVIGENSLKKMKKDCLCIDLASAPGGVDFVAAEKLGIKTLWAQNLPGKTAPASVAAGIKDTVFNILKEKG